MPQDQATVTAVGMTPHTYEDWCPIVLELTANEIHITMFYDLWLVDAALQALQASREGQLGVRRYEPEKAPLAYILGLELFPFAPARRISQGIAPKRGLSTLIIRQGLLGMRLDKQYANIGSLWVRYAREYQAPFLALAEALQREIASRPGVPLQERGMADRPGQTPDSSPICPQCGQPATADSSFCPHCGARLRVVCDHCGKQLKPGDRFCPECGTPDPSAQ